MAVTLQVLLDLQKEVAGLCPDCLQENITLNTSVLGDLIDIADNMAKIRCESFENEELYQRAFCEVISAILIIAMSTAEFVKRPPVLAVLSVN
jgi:hypothetical protein